jgi:ribulose-5-phosphate 4-epimerase/fuculose-1-phosphate aldolase
MATTIAATTLAPSAATAKQRRSDISSAEWELRQDLAAAYQLCALNGWTDSIANHISARIPGEETFLINPWGLRFEEVTASNLVKIDLEGNILSETEYSINLAGYVIHSAVHEARPDVGCVLHLHTDNGVAVSCLEEGLLPLSQTSMLVTEQVAYHEWEGVAFELGERERLAEHMGDRNYVILYNHGTLTTGKTVGEAFSRMWRLERACAIQLKVLATGRPIKTFDPEAQERTAAVGRRMGGGNTNIEWDAFRRQLDRVTTAYKN